MARYDFSRRGRRFPEGQPRVGGGARSGRLIPKAGPTIKVSGKPKPVTLGELARRDVLPAYASQRALVNRLLARESADAQAKAQWMQQVYANFARFLQSMAPDIQGFYRQAGNDISNYARGNSMGLALQEGQSAHGVQNVLDLINAPAGQAPPNYDAAGKLYALTGYLPASTIAGQGAAWGSYAAGLPGIYAQKGIQDIGTMFGESAKRRREISDKLLEIGAAEAADIVKQKNLLRGQRATERENKARLAEQRRQYNLDLKFKRDVARAQNLLDNKKYDLSVKELEQRIAEANAAIRQADRRGDISAKNAATTRLQYLRGLKQDAIAKRNENRRIIISEYNSGAITMREMQRKLGNPKWRSYPPKRKGETSGKGKGKGKGGGSASGYPGK